MNKGLLDTIGGIFFIAMGLWFTTFHKAIGKKAMQEQQKFLEKILHLKINFGMGTIKFTQYGYLIIGIIFIIGGFSIVLHIFR